MPPSFVADRHRHNVETPMSASTTLRDNIEGLINFALGDPDITTDERITRAAMDAALSGHTHYTDAAGIPELRRAITSFHAQMYGESIDADEVMVTTSACHGLYVVLQTMCDPGDEIIVVEPFFTPYLGQIEGAGATPVVVSPSPDEGWKLTPEQLRQAITEKTRAVILNTPANPSGVSYTREELEAFAEVIIGHDILAIADDIYTAFVFDGEFVPLATLDGMRERTVTLRSFSKDWAMTGWRIGYFLAPREFVKVARELNENIVFASPEPIQYAALKALELAPEIRSRMGELYRHRVLHAWKGINTIPGLRAQRPGGGIYLWVDVRETGMTGVEFATFALEEAQVLVIPGIAFGPTSQGFVRLALTVDEDKTDEAFERIRAALAARSDCDARDARNA